MNIKSKNKAKEMIIEQTPMLPPLLKIYTSSMYCFVL